MSPPPSPAAFSAQKVPPWALSSSALFNAALIALVSWAAFLAQSNLSIQRMLEHGYTSIDGIGRLLSYLTNLTALLSAICYSALTLPAQLWLGQLFRKPQVTSAVTAYLMFVGVAYNLLLRQLWHPSGWQAVLNETLHSVLPVLSVLYWCRFVPRFTMRAQQLWLWLVYPIGYLCVTLWRGAESGFYPYPFINVAKLGYPQVLLNASGLLIGFLLLIGLLLVLNRFGKRRMRDAA